MRPSAPSCSFPSFPAATKGGRVVRTYALTAAGKRVHDSWLCNVARASGPGMDPFRTRAGLWSLLAPPKRQALMRALESEIVRLRDAMKAAPSDDAIEAITQTLHIAVMEQRLAWLKRERS